MTFSVLMYALMVSSLTALVLTLVVDALRGERRESTRRTAGPTPRYGRGRARGRWDCAQPRRPAPANTARVRRGGMRSSCPR
jgi:hypothetical protein